MAGLFSAIGSAFGPIGTVIGGAADMFLGDKEERSANNQARAQKDLEYQRQKEFAQMGIRWRTEDAKAAGLHPLAALGTQGTSYSPQAVIMPGKGGDNFVDMGQNLTRSKLATATETERRMEELALRNAELRNDLLEAQIAGLRQPQNPPAPDAVGVRTAPVGAQTVIPSRSISSAPGRPHLEAASTPGFQDVRIGGGATLRLPNQQTAEILENLGPGMGAVVTGLSSVRELVHGPAKPSTALPPGYYWSWNPFTQSFTARKDRPKRSTPPRSTWTPSGIARKRFSGGATGSW